MKLVLLAIGFVFSVVSTQAMASGCDRFDEGEDQVTMSFMISGQLICVAGSVCVFDAEGSNLNLVGTEFNNETSTQYFGDLNAKITNHRSWGSCSGRAEEVVVSVEIKGQTYSAKLSSYSGN